MKKAIMMLVTLLTLCVAQADPVIWSRSTWTGAQANTNYEHLATKGTKGAFTLVTSFTLADRQVANDSTYARPLQFGAGNSVVRFGFDFKGASQQLKVGSGGVRWQGIDLKELGLNLNDPLSVAMACDGRGNYTAYIIVKGEKKFAETFQLDAATSGMSTYTFMNQMKTTTYGYDTALTEAQVIAATSRNYKHLVTGGVNGAFTLVSSFTLADRNSTYATPLSLGDGSIRFGFNSESNTYDLNIGGTGGLSWTPVRLKDAIDTHGVQNVTIKTAISCDGSGVYTAYIFVNGENKLFKNGGPFTFTVDGLNDSGKAALNAYTFTRDMPATVSGYNVALTEAQISPKVNGSIPPAAAAYIAKLPSNGIEQISDDVAKKIYLFGLTQVVDDVSFKVTNMILMTNAETDTTTADITISINTIANALPVNGAINGHIQLIGGHSLENTSIPLGVATSQLTSEGQVIFSDVDLQGCTYIKAHATDKAQGVATTFSADFSSFDGWLKEFGTTGVVVDEQFVLGQDAGQKAQITLITRADTKDRVKIRATSLFGYGTYTWEVFIPTMGVGDQASVGAFIYYSDTREVDFEIGYGTSDRRTAANAQADDLLVCCTNQADPTVSKYYPIKRDQTYTLSIRITPASGTTSFIEWLVNGSVIQTQTVNYTCTPDMFRAYCSVENLWFMGDHVPKQDNYARFSAMTYTPLVD